MNRIDQVKVFPNNQMLLIEALKAVGTLVITPEMRKSWVGKGTVALAVGYIEETCYEDGSSMYRIVDKPV